MIPQKPITDYKEVASRIMSHLWGNGLFDWDANSPGHRFWKRWAKKHFNRLKKMSWLDIYKEARKIEREE
jgi:hypothetical protein